MTRGCGSGSMRRDQRSRALSGKAAVWAFVVETLLLGAGMVWGTFLGQQKVAGALGLVLAAGLLTYLVAQGRLGRQN